jgi:hypothetical protein
MHSAILLWQDVSLPRASAKVLRKAPGFQEKHGALQAAAADPGQTTSRTLRYRADTMAQKFRYQPGWATPIVVDYDKPSFLAWLLGFAREQPHCLARRQGKCPGLDHCHDCSWSRQSASP